MARIAPSAWHTSDAYLFGVDLYNHGFLWEAHEAWEGLWHISKPDRLQALFLQGLIQCAAAWLKIPMQQPQGLARLSALGLEKLAEVERAGGTPYMGLDLDAFRQEVAEFAAAAPAVLDGYPRLVLED